MVIKNSKGRWSGSKVKQKIVASRSCLVGVFSDSGISNDRESSRSRSRKRKEDDGGLSSDGGGRKWREKGLE